MIQKISIPEADFASAGYDANYECATRTLLLILSTPRSGSTMICDLIYRSGLCVPHEYFQPFQYRPMLSERWGIDPDDDEGYISALCKHRTSPSGILGVNLHGHHIQHWERARKHLPSTINTIRQIHLRRRDKFMQAVSYSIAKQTGAWSSDFEPSSEPEYRYDDIVQRLKAINDMERAIYKFKKNSEVRSATYFYEDIARDPRGVLRYISNSPPETPQIRLRQQRGAKNRELYSRFKKEHRLMSRAYRMMRNLLAK